MKDKDDLIKRLIRLQGADKAPEGFTERIISKLGNQEEVEADSIFTNVQWGMIVFGIAAAIFVVIFLDIPIFGDILSSDRLSSIQFGSVGKQLTDWANQFFSSFRFSSIAVMVLAASLLLFGIERIIRFRQNQANLF